MALKYVTENEVRQFVWGDTTSGTDEYDSASMTQLIEDAENEVEDLIFDDFDSNLNTEYQDGNGMDYFYLKRFPVSSITSLKVDDANDGSFTTLIENTDFVLYSDVGRIVLKNDGQLSIFAKYLKNVEIVYTSGFTTIPFRVRNLICTLVANNISPNKIPDFQVKEMKERIRVHKYNVF